MGGKFGLLEMFSTVPVGASALACYYIQFYLFVSMSEAVGSPAAALNHSFYGNYKWPQSSPLQKYSCMDLLVNIFHLLKFKIKLLCFLLVRVFQVILVIVISSYKARLDSQLYLHFMAKCCHLVARNIISRDKPEARAQKTITDDVALEDLHK